MNSATNKYRWFLPFLLVVMPTIALAAAQEPTIDFLAGDEARKAIVDDSTQPYFSRFSDAEMTAKTGRDIPDGPRAQRLEVLKQQYQEAVEDFSPQEQEALRWYVKGLHEPLASDYPVYENVPWRFIKIKSRLETGMPHTRGGCIVLSDQILGAMVGMKDKAPQQAAMAHMGGLLVHEKLHVLQRQDPKRFDDLYTRIWGFEKAKSIEGTDKLQSRWIVNPDGPDVNWIMPIAGDDDKNVTYVWPLILFSDPNHPSLRRMQMSAVSVKKAGDHFAVELNDNGEPVIHDLLSIDGYTAKFFPSTYIYHPNEAAADLFSRIVVLDHFGGKAAIQELPDADRIQAALAPIRTWFKDHLAK